jgi:alpha-L-rhamnosidase
MEICKEEEIVIKDFRISYFENPIGLDEIPRFSWKIESSGKDVMQSAYRLQVRTGKEVVWDTDKVVSDQSIGICYEGGKLTAITSYQVYLTVWGSNDAQWESSGTFETGLLSQDNWHARWITHELPAEETACPIYIRNVRFDQNRIKRARIYATACGVYEIELNGKKVGDTFMAPGWTSYHKRIQYQTYPVTDLLKDENEISITVANGWYKGELGFDIRGNNYGDRTALRAMLLVEYTDGRVETIGTDTDWEVFTGAIRSSEIYHGETVDYTYIHQRLGQAVLFDQTDKIGQIVAQESEPVRITKRFPAQKKIVTPKGELVLDFGQNLTGLVEIKLPPLIGDRLTIRYAETLDEKGNFFTDNLRGAKCTDTFLYTDRQVNQVVMPRFTFHGYRYIALEGVSRDVETERFVSCAMHTDMAESGSFRCDNQLINQLQSNITWGQRSNFLDIPTDCPQRDERLGWTGDAQVFSNTASYNFHTIKFFEKWLHDVAAETTEAFGVPHVVPNILSQKEGAAAWSDCATIIPWNLYQTYGDPQILENQYESMKMWVSISAITVMKTAYG